MEKLILLLFDYVLVFGYALVGFAAFLIVQLVSYRMFNFNLYKKIKKILEV